MKIFGEKTNICALSNPQLNPSEAQQALILLENLTHRPRCMIIEHHEPAWDRTRPPTYLSTQNKVRI